jgi:HEPN superfamily Apea-like protein/ApeA-like protein
MADRFDIQSEFETEGCFWEPGTPAQSFSAHLSATSKRIELTKAAERVGMERLFSRSDDEPAPDILHGDTLLGPCTLIGLQGVGGFGSGNPSTGNILRALRFRISLCILGLHLTNESAPEIHSATFNYAGLESWLRSDAQISLTDDGVIIRHPRNSPPLLDFSLVPTRTRMQLRVASNLQFSPARTHSAGAEPCVIVEPAIPASLEGLLDSAYRLENFLSLWIGTSVRLRTVWLKDSSEKKGWVIRRVPTDDPAEEPDIQAWVRADASQLAGAIIAWMTTPEEFRPVENLVYGVIRSTPLFVETEFLSLAQALESLHRLTDTNTMVERSLFKQICAALEQSIRAICNHPSLAERFEDAIRYANEPSFRNRITSLISRIRTEHAETLLGDVSLFERTLRQTRNFLTHPGIKRQAEVLTGTKELFLFNQKLHAFLRLLLLLNLGVSEDVAFEPVRYQSRKWK